MAVSTKPGLRILLASCVLALAGGVSGQSAADPYDFDDIEVQEEFGEAIVTLDAPPDAQIEHSNDATRGEMTLTFRGTSIRLPRRVYSGEGTLKSVDLEPWFSEGERLTRLVVHYEPGSTAMFEREGDILFVAVEGTGSGKPVGAQASAATPQPTNTADSGAVAARTETPSETAKPADPTKPEDQSKPADAPLVAQAADTTTKDVAHAATAAPDAHAAAAPAPDARDAATASTSTAPESSSTTPASSAAAPAWSAWSTDAPPTDSSKAASSKAAAAGWNVADLWKQDTDASPASPADAFAATGSPAAPPATMSAPPASHGTAAPVVSSPTEPVSASPSVVQVPAELASSEPRAVAASETHEAPASAESHAAEPASTTATASLMSDMDAGKERPTFVEPMTVSTASPASDARTAEATPAGRGSDVVQTPAAMPNASPAAPAKARTRPADAQPSVPPSDEGPNISIDLQGADIHTVLRSIAESSGRNIVANSGVEGVVTLRLTNVPWRRALNIILRTQGLDYVEELGVIRVAPADVLRAEDIETETAGRKKDSLVALETSIMPVQFATADELKLSVSSVLTQRGKIDVDNRTNSLIVTDIPATIPVVRQLVKDLDSKTPQVEIIARLVDLDVSAARELGIKWGAENIHSTAQVLSGSASLDAEIAQPVGTLNFGIIRDFADLDVKLQALEQRQKANIISNPKISTVNNREARILVGQEIPLVVQDEAGNPITELKKIGIELRVTPYINQGDLITLDLHPEVSDLASQSSGAGGIIINTSEADTRVMVENGETAVIGGMVRQNETEVVRGVPVLSQIPILGGLFRSKSKSDSKRELVIFVTPRIVP